MPRKSTRNFLADFARLGIEYLTPKGPQVSDDVQMVFVLEDLSASPAFVPGFTQQTPVQPTYACDINVFSAVGQNATIEIRADPDGGGLWASAITRLNNLAIHLWSIAAFSGLATTFNPTEANCSAFGDGSPATAVIQSGPQVSADPVNAMLLNIGFAQFGWTPNMILKPVYIGPGRVLVCESTSAGASPVQMGYFWHEVP